MSDVLQEIKGYLGSIEHNAVYAENATTERYEMYKKTVIDCKEAVLSLFQKLDREYWELLERFGQLQTKAERYEKVLKQIASHELFTESYFCDLEANELIYKAQEALEGEE